MRNTDHSVMLSGLTPATRYYYEVASPPWLAPLRQRTYSFVTPPYPGAAVPVRVWVLGDSGTRTATQKAVRDAFYRFVADRLPDLWLMLGDNAYRMGTDAQYQKAVFDIYSELLARSPLWPALGNHDTLNADPISESGVYFDVFNLPSRGQCGGVMSGTEAYYAFDHANVHFICLDSEGNDRRTNGPMLTWLKKDLKANQQMWTIAFWHQPPYTKGSHDSDRGLNMREMREGALPILEAAGVDLVLGGHSHSYERSYLIDGHYGTSTTFSESMIKANPDGTPDNAEPYTKTAGASHSGTVYVVAGSSGQIGHISRTPHPAMCVSLEVAGSLVLDVAGSRLDFRFLDQSGQIRDSFTLLKQVPADVPRSQRATTRIDDN